MAAKMMNPADNPSKPKRPRISGERSLVKSMIESGHYDLDVFVSETDLGAPLRRDIQLKDVCLNSLYNEAIAYRERFYKSIQAMAAAVHQSSGQSEVVL